MATLPPRRPPKWSRAEMGTRVGALAASMRIDVVPMRKTAPGPSSASAIRTPSAKVPFVLPASTMRTELLRR